MNYSITISPSQFEKMLRIIVSQPEVQNAILSSHDNNRWWPNHVKDWRTRMLIAGLSARISYRMLPIYREIVDVLDSMQWNEIKNLSDIEFKKIISKIGLFNNRMMLWKSLTDFIDKLENDNINISAISNDELIQRIQKDVNGASYKLAQCCSLYAKGYHCGIIPIDSGMKDTLAPCLGFPIPKNELGHEIFRKQLEKLSQICDCYKIAYNAGYKILDFPKNKPLTWFVHIALISYKRYFCNNRYFQTCPLRQEFNGLVGCKCSKENPENGGNRCIIIEGIDRAGKSTLSENLKKFGYEKFHFGYIKGNTREDILNLYKDLFNNTLNKRIVMDRSFISELVYGSVLRGKSRLSFDDISQLLDILKGIRTTLIYVYAPNNTIIERLKSGVVSKQNIKIIRENSEELINYYESVIKEIEQYIPTLRFNTLNTNTVSIVNQLLDQ